MSCMNRVVRIKDWLHCMGKALIIAEKPSVASDISKALGKFQKHEDHFENDEYVI